MEKHTKRDSTVLIFDATMKFFSPLQANGKKLLEAQQKRSHFTFSVFEKEANLKYLQIHTKRDYNHNYNLQHIGR